MVNYRIGMIAAALAIPLSLPAGAQEGVAIKNLLGTIGIIPAEREPIRYNERAPLVLPPKMELREPNSRTAAKTNPQWPNDPDVAAKRRQQEAARLPVTESETRRMSENNPRLSVEELRGGRNPNSGRVDGPVIRRGDNARDVLMLSPDELRAGPKPEDREAAQYVNGEPLRRSLTEPPTGLRRTSTGLPTKGTMDARVDQQTLDADPRNWLREQAQSSD